MPLVGSGSMQLGRLVVGQAASALVEPVGDPIGATGGSVVPAPRVPQQYQIALATVVSGASTLLQAQKLRRQLRAMLNNTPLKLQGFVYLVYADDPELNAWLSAEPTTLSSPDPVAGQAVGLWQTPAFNFSLLGRKRTHREARSIWMKPLWNGLYERDQLAWIISSDFSALGSYALPLSVLPHGATQLRNSVTGQVVVGNALPTGRDGGVSLIASGLVDLTVISYERPESALNLSDVVVYDRRGQITAPSIGPDTNWEEVPGPDYPWNWLTAGQPQDSPVLDNGLVRVRWDGTNSPGFRVDIWSGSAYVEQGKMVFARIAGVTRWDDTWVAASLVECTPERAVLRVLLSASTDASSMETVFVTMERGVLGATFEIYTALQANNSVADAALVWAPAGTPDVNDSVMKSDTQVLPVLANSGASVSTAGTGGSLWTDQQQVGAASFLSSENYVSLLRFPTASVTLGPYQHNLVVLQGNLTALTSRSGVSFGYAYGQTQNQIVIQSTNGQGYVQVQVNFSAVMSDQAQEAEAIRNVSGTTSQIADANASGGQAVKDTQLAATNNTLVKAGTNLLQAKYRVFARVRADALAHFKVTLGTGSAVGAIVSSTSWQWIDFGDVLASGATPTLGVVGWGQAQLPTPSTPSVVASTGGGSGAGSVTAYYKVTAMAGSGETLGSTEVSATTPATLPAPTGVTAQWITGGGLNGSPRYYKVSALNAAGETIGSSEAASGTAYGQIQNQGGSVFVSWAVVPGASFYRIYVGTTSGGENAYWTIPSSQTYFIDSGTLATTAGSPSGTNSAFVDSASVTVTWPAITGATSYRVYRGTAAGAENVYFVVTPTSNFLPPPSGLQGNRFLTGAGHLVGHATYYWRVTAVNGAGETTGSAEIFDSGSGNAEQLDWSFIPGATSYNVYRSTVSGGEMTSPALVANVAGGGTSYLDLGNALLSGAVPAMNTALGNITFIDTGAAGTSGSPPGANTTQGVAYIDRVEMFLSEDRVRGAAAIYSGARDRAFAALYDSRQLGTLVAR